MRTEKVLLGGYAVLLMAGEVTGSCRENVVRISYLWSLAVNGFERVDLFWALYINCLGNYKGTPKKYGAPHRPHYYKKNIYT